MERIILRSLVLLVLLGGSEGCSQVYTGSMQPVRTELKNGNPDQALRRVEDQLQTTADQEMPTSISGDQALYLLERGVLQQAVGDFSRSARDLMTADNRLEYLDLSTANSLELGKYLYSERSTTYRAPAHERLTLNALNMINFLARGNDEGARVEARRFDLIEHFFVREDEQVIRRELRAFGHYMGGVSFERGGNFLEAARHYGKAYYFGINTEPLRKRLVDLYRLTGYKPGELRAKDRTALEEISSAASTGSISREQYKKQYLSGGDTLIILQTGMVPYRETKRYSVDRSLRIARGTNHPRLHLTDDEATRFRSASVRAGFSTIPFLELTQGGMPPNRTTNLRTVSPESKELSPFAHVNLALQVEQAWKERRGALMAAAITRFLTRLAAAGVITHQVRQSTDSRGLGILAGLTTYLTLSALDQPDTRSWVTLPGEIRLFRTNLSPESHRFRIQVDNQSIAREVTIREQSLNVLNFSRLR